MEGGAVMLCSAYGSTTHFYLCTISSSFFASFLYVSLHSHLPNKESTPLFIHAPYPIVLFLKVLPNCERDGAAWKSLSLVFKLITLILTSACWSLIELMTYSYIKQDGRLGEKTVSQSETVFPSFLKCNQFSIFIPHWLAQQSLELL